MNVSNTVVSFFPFHVLPRVTLIVTVIKLSKQDSFCLLTAFNQPINRLRETILITRSTTFGKTGKDYGKASKMISFGNNLVKERDALTSKLFGRLDSNICQNIMKRRTQGTWMMQQTSRSPVRPVCLLVVDRLQLWQVSIQSPSVKKTRLGDSKIFRDSCYNN